MNWGSCLRLFGFVFKTRSPMLLRLADDLWQPCSGSPKSWDHKYEPPPCPASGPKSRDKEPLGESCLPSAPPSLLRGIQSRAFCLFVCFYFLSSSRFRVYQGAPWPQRRWAVWGGGGSGHPSLLHARASHSHAQPRWLNLAEFLGRRVALRFVHISTICTGAACHNGC